MRHARLLPIACLLPLLAGCGALNHGILNAQGPVAEHERHLFLIVCGILLFVAVPVLILVPAFAWYYRQSNRNGAYRPKWAFSWPIEGFIWLPPLGIVVLLAFLLWPATQRDDPYTRLAERGPPLRIQAVALDWKWVFIYPQAGVATVNQLAMPAGRPVQIELTSGTVMQSLLLPQLAGQIYAMAGMRTRLNFAADRPGRYLGENVQFNGMKFAQQKFPIVAMTPAGYERWLLQARGGRHPLDAASWSMLSQRSVTPPQTFSSVPAGLFDRVLAVGGDDAHPHSVSQRAH